MLALKVLAVSTAPPLGLKVSYWAGTTATGAPERSTDFAWLNGATRIDARLDLRGEEFGVHFFNDAARFNFGPEVVPARDQLPFSVRWEGWLWAPSDGARRFTVESSGPSQLWIDDAALPAGGGRTNLTAGLHPIRVEYTRPEARVAYLRVAWERTPGEPLQTVGAPDARWMPSTAIGTVSNVADATANIGLAALALAAMALAIRRYGWTAGALLSIPVVFAGYGALVEAPGAGRATILSGLDDWLVYESSARDILLNGWLMNGGAAHAQPFYGQPLYPYVLALAHRLTGEALFGPIVLQFAALGGMVVLTGVLASIAFGSREAGLAALASLVVLLQLEPEHFKIARQLFNENVYMPLVLASLITIVALVRRDTPPRWQHAASVGVLLGLTAVARSQFLLFVPFGLVIVWLAWRRNGSGQATWKTALVAAGLVVAIAPITARNWIVSGQFVPISSSGGASLLEFHRPPPGLIDQSALQHDPLFDALHLDIQTRTVLAFMRADPRGYLATLAPLGAHSLGLQGRNDPGLYWPLLITVLAYLTASFSLRRTRQLRVWPIHAFVATHLLVLMLFEADTYGYRLVMPMYAPMVAVAAQLPLAGVRAFIRSRNTERATRIAYIGWSTVGLIALAWQAKGLIEIWPERDTTLHGLGGAAAHAAQTADRAGARAIYVASVDGTPRRFGSGSLPGLRYPWFKWFDPQRSLPLPPANATAVYMLSELAGLPHTSAELTSCLGPPDASGEVTIASESARQQCAEALLTGSPLDATFDGLARVEALQVPKQVAAGEALEAQLVWQPIVAHPDAHLVSLQLDDPSTADGMLSGNGTLDLYPAAEWQPDEAVLSRLRVATDPTAIPQAYRLTLGIAPTRPNAAPAMATWQGVRSERIPVASVTLTLASVAESRPLPSDMQPVSDPGAAAAALDGGLQLIGSQALPPEAATGSPLRVGLLWKAVEDAPSAAEFKLRLVRASGEIVQETTLPVFGGRLAPNTLHVGNAIRDEQSIMVSPRAPNETLSLELVTGSMATVRLGSINVTGRAHVTEATSAEPEATFGGVMALLSDKIEQSAKDRLTVTLRWRAAAEMQRAYKVFVHVLDSGGTQVIAQRDAEPQSGAAPTTSWLIGEVIDDEYSIALPAGFRAGEYPVEVGVYDPNTGERLRLENGDNHLILAQRAAITR